VISEHLLITDYWLLNTFMKIGLIIYGGLDTMSGGYLYDRQLVSHLEGYGDEVQVFALPWLGYGRHLSQNFTTQFYNQLRKAKLSLLLQDELNHPSLFWFNHRLRPYTQYPIISVVHQLRINEARPRWQNRVYGWVERWYLRSVDGFIFNSLTTRYTVEQMVGHSKPHVVAYPGSNRFDMRLEPHTIAARAYDGDKLRVLFVGNLIERKGLHVLLAALAQLPSDVWQLDVVGNTDVSPLYTQSITQRLNGSAVTLHGSLSDEALAALMKQSHILAVPSSYEGFGIVYAEGMSVGLPAIGTTAGAAREIIRQGENGYLVEPNDADLLAQRLRQMQQDRHLLARMSLAAFNYSQQHATWSESMHKVRQFLLEF
jgi:glycosyltransferase involved in cell wall biosynthesis